MSESLSNGAELSFTDEGTFLIMDGIQYPELSDCDNITENDYVLTDDGDICDMSGINRLLVDMQYSKVKAWAHVDRVFKGIVNEHGQSQTNDQL